MDCIFCKIANNEIPSDKVYEDDKILVFKYINSQAKIHWLVIPKTHYKNIVELPTELSSYIIDKIKEIVKEYNIEDDGFRLVVNTNKNGGQEVFHVHFHILAGEKLSGKMG